MHEAEVWQVCERDPFGPHGGGPDEIGDVVCDTTKNILSHIEDQHHQTLDKVK